MDISYISSVYDVRKLSEEDIEDIYQLAVENPMYYQYCPPFVTRETILKDMKALPAGKNYEDKYYIGFWDKEKLAAVMDLLLDYPDKNTAFVGFFMMNRSLQGKGVGSAIIEEFCSCMKNQKYTYIRLGYVKDNPQSRRFWMKNHFEKTGIEYSDARYEIVVLQRLL
ncbi:MAG: GNAT family N-acetyltransferase [Lachnospiraceae bacterium]|nr:GNAT family N-acetyltransferase [Lachnospiraceae bacterium]